MTKRTKCIEEELRSEQNVALDYARHRMEKLFLRPDSFKCRNSSKSKKQRNPNTEAQIGGQHKQTKWTDSCGKMSLVQRGMLGQGNKDNGRTVLQSCNPCGDLVVSTSSDLHPVNLTKEGYIMVYLWPMEDSTSCIMLNPLKFLQFQLGRSSNKELQLSTQDNTIAD